MKWESADLRVGLLLVASAVVGIGSFVWLTPSVSDDSVPYYADFANVDGLTTQSDVLVAGFQVGRVAEIVASSDSTSGRMTFRVRMQLRPRLAGDRPFRVPRGTIARLVQSAFIGAASVSLEPPARAAGLMAPGAILKGELSTGLNDQLKLLAGELGEDIKKTLRTATKLLDSLQLVAHDARNATAGVVDLTRKGSEELPVLVANVNRDLNSVDSLVRELRTLSPALKGSLDSVNLLVSDTRKSVNTVTGMVKDREPEMARIAANLDSTAVMLRWFVEQVARRPMRAITGVTIPVLSPRDVDPATKPPGAPAGAPPPAAASPSGGRPPGD